MLFQSTTRPLPAAITPLSMSPDPDTAPKWTAANSARIEALLGSLDSQDTVVLDLDHTIQPLDIGDAAFRQLHRHPTIMRNARLMPISLGTDSTLINTIPDPWQRYLAACACQPPDASGDLNILAAYEWIVTSAAGMSAAEIVQATARAHAQLVATLPLNGASPAPPLYGEVVELIGRAMDRGARASIVSASSSLSVRWIVNNILNPALQLRGYQTIAAEDVYGMAPKYKAVDSTVREERELIQEPAFSRLDPDYLASLTILPLLSRPSTGFAGKRETIERYISRTPTCVVGDSAGDLHMMSIAKQSIWIAQLEKPTNQQRLLLSDHFRRNSERFIIQPALANQFAGFISAPPILSSVGAATVPTVTQSLERLGQRAFG